MPASASTTTPPRTRKHQRRLRHCARRPGPGASTRRRRALAPVRPRPRRATRNRQPPAPADQAADPARRAANPRRDDPSAGVHPKRRLDLLAANRLGYALYSTYLTPGRPANTARFVFLDPRSEDFYDDWDHIANEVVAILRSEAGRTPYDRALSDLIGELSTQSETFRTKWAAHNVRSHDTGTKRLHHPVVGDLELTYEAMQPSADTGLTMFAYTAEPGSKSDQALQLLGSWAATPTEPDLTRTTDQA